MCIKGREEARGGFYYVKFWKSNGKKVVILLTNPSMAATGDNCGMGHCTSHNFPTYSDFLTAFYEFGNFILDLKYLLWTGTLSLNSGIRQKVFIWQNYYQLVTSNTR
jgi:hypothetical protein